MTAYLYGSTSTADAEINSSHEDPLACITERGSPCITVLPPASPATLPKSIRYPRSNCCPVNRLPAPYMRSSRTRTSFRSGRLRGRTRGGAGIMGVSVDVRRLHAGLQRMIPKRVDPVKTGRHALHYAIPGLFRPRRGPLFPVANLGENRFPFGCRGETANPFGMGLSRFPERDPDTRAAFTRARPSPRFPRPHAGRPGSP